MNTLILLAITGLLVVLYMTDNVHLANICYIIRPFLIPVGYNQEVIWETGPAVVKDTPNVVMIVLDDWGFNDVSFYGGGYHFGNISTPHIDSVAHRGMSFDNAYAGHATCSPSRAALLTGRFATSIGYEFTPSKKVFSWILGSKMDSGELKGITHKEALDSVYDADQALPDSEVTIAEALQDTDYRSIIIGKWHLGNKNKSMPLSQGFSEALSYNLGIRFLGPWDSRAENCKLPDFFDRFQWGMCPHAVQYNHGKRFEIDGYSTDYFGNEASKAIIANKNRPFFLYVSPNAIHAPLQALKEDYDKLSYIEDHCDRVYAAIIVATDRAVGKILTTLKNENLEDNTIVIVTSDNGGSNMVSRPRINHPFRGWKASFFEGGFRVPLFMRWPQKIPPGSSFTPVVSHVDLFPTIISAVGETVSHSIDGVDLLPHILADDARGDSIGQQGGDGDAHAFEKERSRDVLESGKIDSSDARPIDLIHENLFWRAGHYKAMRKGFWKIQKIDNPPKVWLFDLQYDPTEQQNLALSEREEHQDRVQAMRLALAEEDAKQVPPLWPSVSETPFLVDKVWLDPYEHGDEYVYWPN